MKGFLRTRNQLFKNRNLSSWRQSVHTQTKEGVDLPKRAETLGIKYFLVSFLDLLGNARAKLVPRNTITDVLKHGAGFHPFSSYLGMTPAHPDIVAIPDPSSLVQLPWNREVGWLASDIYMDGKPLPQCPRTALKQQVERAKSLGYVMQSGVECEFYLLQGGKKNPQILDELDTKARPCYSQLDLMRRYEFVSKLMDNMASLGWEPYQSDHEDGNGQFELNWKFSDALTTADRFTFFKFMTKSLAENYGWRVTFMPKPFSNMPGNGIHSHINLSDLNTNKNLFLPEQHDIYDVGLSELGYQFLAGILHHAPSYTAITNPTINSYKRLRLSPSLSGSTWAPNLISYTDNNRTHMIRIPAAGRFEVRVADGATHPYLFHAILLSAGLDGVKKKLNPGRPMKHNAHETSAKEHEAMGLKFLPTTLWGALDLLEKSDTFKSSLGKELIDIYVQLKRDEIASFLANVSQWEIDNTLDC